MTNKNSPWVVTGEDRDKAYQSIMVGIFTTIVGVIVLYDQAWWWGIGVTLFGLAAIASGRARLRGEI